MMLKYLFLSFSILLSAALPQASSATPIEQSVVKQNGEPQKTQPKKKKKKKKKASAGKNPLLERAVAVKWLTGTGTRTWESTSIVLNDSAISGHITYTFDARGSFQEVNQDMPMRARWQLKQDLKTINLSERRTPSGPEAGDFIITIKELTDQKLVVQYAKPSGKGAGGAMVITFRAVE